MDVKHLTDEEIQDYLDKNESISGIEVEKHVIACAHCQIAILQYKKFYENLKDDTGISLPNNFAQLVIAKLSVKSKLIPQLIFSDSFLGFLGIIIAVTGLLYYSDLNTVHELLNQFNIIQGEFDSMFISLLKKFEKGLNENFYILIVAGVILFIINEIDLLYLQPKIQKLSIKNRMK